MVTTLPDPPADLALRREEPLAAHTYLRLGGPAAYFGVPADLDAVVRIAAWAADHRLPLRVIGGGSNVLVADEGVRAVVISLRRACSQISWDGEQVTAGAAVMLPALARSAGERGLSGLEFAIGIPGAVGGALQTNAGIGDGRCIGDLVERVEVLREGRLLTLRRDAIEFEYRETSLRGSGDLVLAATLALQVSERGAVESSMRRLLEARQRTQPTAERNAGSIFRNPPGDAAGRLIDAAGCKGMREGDARVSELHANFIVHSGAGTARDYVTLMARVQEQVEAAFGIRMVPEVEWWGDGDAPPVFQTESVREDG